MPYTGTSSYFFSFSPLKWAATFFAATSASSVGNLRGGGELPAGLDVEDAVLHAVAADDNDALVGDAKLQTRGLHGLNGAGRLVVRHGKDAVDAAARIEAHQKFAGDLLGQGGIPFAVFDGDQLEAGFLASTALKAAMRSWTLNCCASAGHRDDLRLGLASAAQPLDHALAGKASKLAVIGADIGREQLVVFLLQGRDDSTTGMPAAFARVRAGTTAWSLT